MDICLLFVHGGFIFDNLFIWEQFYRNAQEHPLDVFRVTLLKSLTHLQGAMLSYTDSLAYMHSHSFVYRPFIIYAQTIRIQRRCLRNSTYDNFARSGVNTTPKIQRFIFSSTYKVWTTGNALFQNIVWYKTYLRRLCMHNSFDKIINVPYIPAIIE